MTTGRRFMTVGAGTLLLLLLQISCSTAVPEEPRDRSRWRGMAAGPDPIMKLTGIPAELASWREKVVERVDYELAIKLAKNADTFRGRCTIEVVLAHPVSTLPVDFRGGEIFGVVVNGATATVHRGPDRILVPGDLLNEGANSIVVDYTAGIGAAGKGLLRARDAEDDAEYVYTLNVPADGHAVLPCFDQPSLKARFTLEVTTPADWRVVANAPLANEEVADGVVRRRFLPTLPISTYLFAFAAGPFHEIATGTAGSMQPATRPMRFLGRASQRELLEIHAPEILRLHRTALEFLEPYFDVPYPFAKFDFVCVPDFPFGGMEHPGCIFYGEDPMLFRSEVTRLREARRADLISHETAHMWFGDYVTMPWFDDVWLKEGFATFMAHKVLEATFDGIDHARGFFLRNIPPALDSDLTRGAAPIRRPLADLADAKSNYGPIIYRKGPAVLRQLEDMMGADRFRETARAFLADHALACGDWNDLLAAFSAAAAPAQRDLIATWSKSWVESPGAPRVRARIIERLAESTRVEVTQEDPAGEGRTWPLVTDVSVHGAVGSAVARVQTTAPRTVVDVKTGAAAWTFGNPGAVTYASFVLDEASRDHVLSHWSEIENPLLRARLWEALWEDVQMARLDPLAWLEHARTRALAEDDERLFALLLERTALALERYVVDDDAADHACAAIEDVLLALIRDPAAPRGHRLIALRAMFGIAWTEAGTTFLNSLLEETLTLDGLQLSDRDRWAMVRRLMLVGDPRAARRLADMNARDRTDDARRQAFLVACARPDVDSKYALFQRFREDPDLPERWVQNALPTFWHSRHAHLTDPLVASALEQLEWIKDHRKIFFLPAWVDACIRSRLDTLSAATAERFVARRGLAGDIRLKTLVPLDHLQRTLAIRANQ